MKIFYTNEMVLIIFPSFFGQVGRIDCEVLRDLCIDLHIHKFPSFLVFKQTGGYEIHYGE